MEEEERAIRVMSFVTTLSPVRVSQGQVKRVTGYPDVLCLQRVYICGKKQEASAHISGERPTLFACLQELRKRLEEHHGLRVKLRQPLSRPSVRPGVLVMGSLIASVVMFQRRSLKEGVPWFRTKSFGRGSKEQTMQLISSRKRISTSGLRDLRITNG